MEFNYREVSFIMNEPEVKIKNMYKDILKTDKVSLDMFINNDVLNQNLGIIRSVDERYDGMFKFDFYLWQTRKSFKKYLNDKRSIKNKRLSGKLDVFYRILSEDEIKVINENLEYKHNYLYAKKK
jgi:hypothetical protein